MKYLVIALFWLALLQIFVFAKEMDTPLEHPFSPGEKLTYRIRWGIFPAGKMVFEVNSLALLDDVLCYHFVMTAETNAFVDKFFMVRDRFEGFADINMSASFLFKKKQHEGKRKKDIVVEFDWDNAITKFSNFGQDFKTVSVTPGSLDPLSFFYKLRLQQLKENQEYAIPVADGEEAFLGKINVLKKKKIRTKAGNYVAYLVKPDMESYGWIFRQTENTQLKIWISADEYKIPVKFSTRVTFGSFTCELISSER